jgi:hypothetical protein
MKPGDLKGGVSLNEFLNVKHEPKKKGRNLSHNKLQRHLDSDESLSDLQVSPTMPLEMQEDTFMQTELREAYQKSMEELQRSAVDLVDEDVFISISSQSSLEDTSVTGRIIQIGRRFFKARRKAYVQLFERHASNPHFVQTLPLCLSLVCYGAILIGTQFSQSMVLNNMQWYNVLLRVYLLLGMTSVSLGLWTLKLGVKLRAAGRLIKGRAAPDDLVGRSWWSRGKLSILSMLLSAGSLVCVCLLCFTSKWSQVSSPVGSFDCVPIRYPSDLPYYSPPPQDVLQGILEFAPSHGFGLPLADGMVVGIGPKPAASPAESFTLAGEGPLAVIQVDCEADPAPWAGINTTAGGVGLIKDSTRSIHLGIIGVVDVVLPGYAVEGWDEFPWVKQRCRVKITAGVGVWSFQYTTDEWDRIAEGQATQLRVGDVTVLRSTSTSFHAKELSDLFTTEADIGPSKPLLPALRHTADSLLDSKWYPAVRPNGLANLLFHATQHGAHYDTKRTWHGLSVALATSLHVLLNSNINRSFGWCNYFQLIGEGVVSIDTTVLTLTQGTLLATCVALCLTVSLTLLSVPTHLGQILNTAAMEVASEWRRLAHFRDYVQHTLARSHNVYSATDFPHMIKKVFIHEPINLTHNSDVNQEEIILGTRRVFSMSKGPVDEDE